MNQLEVIKSKIVDQEDLKAILNRWRFKDEKVVFTNGCFDILHQGHVEYLAQAKNLGSKLILGLNSDDSVRKLNKGSNRPLQGERSRALIMAALHFIDLVVIFTEDTPLKLIKLVQPDVLVKGSDYAVEDIVGHEIVLKNGGKVETIDFLPGFSTSSIVDKAQKK